MPELTDDKLLTMLGSSDDKICNDALTLIYQDNYGIVATFIEKNSGRAQDAKDIFQEGVIAFYEQVRKGAFKGDSTIGTYLFAICRNLWMKRLRKSSTKNEVLGKNIDFAQEDDLKIDEMIADEESEILADLLEQLGADCQKILLFFYYGTEKK